MADQQPEKPQQPEAGDAQAHAGQDADGHLYAYQRVGKYSPVVTASERASQYYTMAKDYNPTVKSGLEKAEAGIASLSAIIWPYVEPALDKVDPAFQKQLNNLEGVYERQAPVVEQKYKDLHSRALDAVVAADAKVDTVLPPASQEEGAQDEAEEKELQEAKEKSLGGEIYTVSAKIAHRLYAHAALNVNRAHTYSMSYVPSKESYQSYVQYVENQKANVSRSLASTQAYILSTVQEGSAAASSKIDDLRKTAAVQTAMDMANSLKQGVANLPGKVPESLTESVNSITGRLQAYYTSLEGGRDDKVQVSATLGKLAEETIKTWEALKANVMSRIATTPGPQTTNTAEPEKN